MYVLGQATRETQKQKQNIHQLGLCGDGGEMWTYQLWLRFSLGAQNLMYRFECIGKVKCLTRT